MLKKFRFDFTIVSGIVFGFGIVRDERDIMIYIDFFIFSFELFYSLEDK